MVAAFSSRSAIHSFTASSAIRIPVRPRTISRGPHPSRFARSYVDLEMPTEEQNSSTVQDARGTGFRRLFSSLDRHAMTLLLLRLASAFTHLAGEQHARVDHQCKKHFCAQRR